MDKNLKKLFAVLNSKTPEYDCVCAPAGGLLVKRISWVPGIALAINSLQL